MFLHCLWNATTSIPGLVFLIIPLYSLLMLGHVGLLAGLVARKGRIIRMHLQDEVLLGKLTREEVMLATSPFGGLRASFSWGAPRAP